MKFINQTILAILAIFLGPLESTASPDVSEPVSIENVIRELLVESPDSLLKLLDTEFSWPLPDFKVNLYKAMAYNELRLNTMKMRYAEKVLVSDSITAYPELRLRAMNILASAQVFVGNYQEGIEILLEAIDIARSAGNKPAEYGIMGEMAKVYMNMGQKQAGYELLDRIVSEGQLSADVRELANVSWALGIKVIWLNDDSCFKEAIKTGKMRLKIIMKIESFGNAPDGYTDQQKAYTYARLASSYERAGMKSEAAECYTKFLSTNFGNTVNGGINIVDYLQESGQYEKVLEMTAPYYSLFANGDTINDDYWSLLYSDAQACKGLGHFRNGYELLYRASVIQDSLQSREKNGRAQEFAAVFQLNEKEKQLIEIQTESWRRQILLIFSLGIGTTVLALLAVVIWHYRKSVKRNKIAAKQIDELMALREETRRSFEERNMESYIKEDCETFEMQEPCKAVSEKNEYDVFIAVESAIVNQLLFLLPTSEKKKVAAQCGISQSRLLYLIKKYSDCGISEYFNRLKVEYSIRLMKQHPEWTIEAVAHTAGYASRNTYYQNFNKVYGMTPMQYRKNSVDIGHAKF